MSKKTFDDAIQNQVNSENRKQEQKAMIDAFNEFRGQDIPKAVEAYDWRGSEVLLEVFKFTPEVEQKVNLEMDESGRTVAQQNTRYFPIARILAAGENAQYRDGEKIEKGDIVKLKDVETMSIETSKYRKWNSDKNRKGSLKPKGEEPTRFVSKIFESYGSFTFVLNPFDTVHFDKGEDDSIYKLSSAKVENKIKDVELLLSLCS